MSTAKIDELIELLKLNPEAEVLDIACGKGEMLARLAEHYTNIIFIIYGEKELTYMT
jgi:cyclopropane fatty-acyl-phospholipid synthase-like methyltransferase